jgi:probable HAF family extracellular repeat protein
MSRKKTFCITLAFLSPIIIVVWMVFSPQRDVRYTITDLGTLGGLNVFPCAINNRGHVAGSMQSAGWNHAFLWTPEDGMQDIGAFLPYAMNDGDEIVGQLLTANNNRACLWTPAEGLTDLGTLGGTRSAAEGINNQSEVVGTSTRVQGGECGFVWTATDGMRSLDREALAFDINDAGEILCSTHSDGTDPFAYSLAQDEVIPSKDLTSSLKFPFIRLRVSESSQGGQICCCLPFRNVEEEFPVPAKEGHGILLSDTNGIQTVGGLFYQNPYLEKALSTKGLPSFLYTVLGKVSYRLMDQRAALWEGEEAVDLTNSIPPKSGWRNLDGAVGINESGQIAGAGTIDGNRRAFLLTPIQNRDEP